MAWIKLNAFNEHRRTTLKENLSCCSQFPVRMAAPVWTALVITRVSVWTVLVANIVRLISTNVCRNPVKMVPFARNMSTPIHANVNSAFLALIVKPTTKIVPTVVA